MSRPSVLAFDATVIAVEDLSPSFRRITFGGPGLSEFGVGGHPRDLRIKLVIPADGGPVPSFDLPAFFTEHDDPNLSWYQAWLGVDPVIRGAMRTYTVREWRDDARELVVDMVLHTDANGQSGPAARWASSAEVGHRLHIIGPARHSEAGYGGIEFAPGDADRLLLVGDETAVPAIASILDSLKDAKIRGRALLEVPTSADRVEVAAPDGLEVEWLVRDGAPAGSLLEPAVRDAVRAEALVGTHVASGGGGRVESSGGIGPTSALIEFEDVDIDAQILWDVPDALTHAARSSSSDTASNRRPFYAWIAGEAGPVKRLRRYLVRDVGVDRRQVAFMGYWRQGRAEG